MFSMITLALLLSVRKLSVDVSRPLSVKTSTHKSETRIQHEVGRGENL